MFEEAIISIYEIKRIISYLFHYKRVSTSATIKKLQTIHKNRSSVKNRKNNRN